MNFLVTGGAGFIGSNLSERLLRDGHAVWVLDDLNDFYSPARKEKNLAELRQHSKFTFYRGDLRDKNAVNELFASTQFDQVIHLAARAGLLDRCLSRIFGSGGAWPINGAAVRVETSPVDMTFGL